MVAKMSQMAVKEICHVTEQFHRCQNVPIQKVKYKWDILASMKLFNHVTYLCHSQFGTFWQPWRKTFVDTFNLFQNFRNHDDKTLFEPFHFSESFL